MNDYKERNLKTTAMHGRIGLERWGRKNGDIKWSVGPQLRWDQETEDMQSNRLYAQWLPEPGITCTFTYMSSFFTKRIP